MDTGSVRAVATRALRCEYAWVGAAFVVLVVVAYVVLRSVTTGTFDRLERENVSSQADRIAASLSYERALIGNFVLTNSQWDDPYDAIVDRDPAAIVVAFPPQQMRSSFGLGAVALLDHAGTVVGGGMVGRSANGFDPVSASLGAGLAKITTRPGTTSCGVLAAVGAHYLFCAAQVIHTDGSGPAAGTLVALKTLDAAGTAAIGHRAGLVMGLAGYRLGGSSARLSSALGPLGVRTVAVSDRRLDLLVSVPAVQGGSPLVFEIAFGRPVHPPPHQE
jgi:sensor domain CHASE-containing protein